MRKKFAIAVQLMLTLAMILAACGAPAAPQATPEVIKETVVVTQQVPVEVVKTVEVPVAPSEYSITVLNPQGAIPFASDLAPRLDTLEGKRVALWLSATPDHTYAGQGAPLYDELAKMLKEKFATIEIIPYTDLPMKYSPADEVIAAITATEPDAVVVAFGG
jgi:hypothetical protein